MGKGLKVGMSRWWCCAGIGGAGGCNTGPRRLGSRRGGRRPGSGGECRVQGEQGMQGSSHGVFPCGMGDMGQVVLCRAQGVRYRGALYCAKEAWQQIGLGGGGLALEGWAVWMSQWRPPGRVSPRTLAVAGCAGCMVCMGSSRVVGWATWAG